MVPEEEYEGQEPKKGKGIFKWIILAVLLLVLGGGAWFAYQKFIAGGDDSAPEQEQTQEEEAQKKEASEDDGKYEIVTLPTFVVNLADPLGRRYLKLSVEVEVKNPEAAAMLSKSEAKVKDAVLLLLSSKTYQELSSLENKMLLKNEIVDRLNQILGGPMVRQVYFTEMVIQ